MKKIVFINSIIFTILFAFATQKSFSQTPDEKEAIKSTALNYIEGWYSADSARMAKALSPELKKKGFIVNPKNNKLMIYDATYSQMIEWTSKKPNELKQNPNIKIEVEINEVGKNIAIVKTISPEFTDYIQMGKIKGEWKIFNIVWEQK
ncbi:MAG: nuclear transport factor 2 family protein [Bacteroidota bacterium]